MMHNRFVVMFAAVLAWALATGHAANLCAQPVIYRIAAPKARPGSEVELTLHGRGFDQVEQVERVRVGTFDAELLGYERISDRALRVRIRIPRRISSGKHRIGFRVVGEGLATWLESVLAENPESAGAPQFELFLEGQALNPNRAEAVSFGTTELGQPVSRTFRIRNGGDATLRLYDLRVPPGFELEGIFPDSIAPGNSSYFYVQFNPETAKGYQGVLSFDTNAENLDRVAFQLSGTANEPVVEPKEPTLEPREPRTEPPQRARRAVLYGVDATPTPAGQTADLVLRGAGLDAVQQVQGIRVGGVSVTLRSYTLASDQELRVRVDLPPTLPAGEHEVTVLVLSEGEERWLAPSAARTARTGAEPVGGTGLRVLPAAPEPPPEPEPVIDGSWPRPWMWWLAGGGLLLALLFLRAPLRTRLNKLRTGKKPPTRPAAAVTLTPVLDFGRQEIRVGGDLVAAEEAVTQSRKRKRDQDDLTRVEGVGPFIAGLLQGVGITTFEQLAQADVTRLRRMLDNASLPMCDPTTWPEQARLAADGRWPELAQLQEELIAGRAME